MLFFTHYVLKKKIIYILCTCLFFQMIFPCNWFCSITEHHKRMRCRTKPSDTMNNHGHGCKSLWTPLSSGTNRSQRFCLPKCWTGCTIRFSCGLRSAVSVMTLENFTNRLSTRFPFAFISWLSNIWQSMICSDGRHFTNGSGVSMLLFSSCSVTYPLYGSHSAEDAVFRFCVSPWRFWWHACIA